MVVVTFWLAAIFLCAFAQADVPQKGAGQVESETAVPQDVRAVPQDVRTAPVNDSVKPVDPAVLESPWDLHPALETGMMIVGLTGMSLDVVYKYSNRGPKWGLDGDSSSINGFDRMVTGWWNPDAAVASDVLLGMSIAVPFIAQMIDTAVNSPEDGWKGYGKDLLVLLETLAVTAGMTNFLKYSIGRARPYSYNEILSDETRLERDAGLSFPSGHTSMAFAMATSWSWLYMKRHPKSPGVVPVWLGSYAVAAATAVMRPVAGKHFWTDIIAGAALGIGVGLLVPYLHELVAKKNRSSRRNIISVAPFALDGGGGAVLTVIR